MPDVFREYCFHLGISTFDVANTVESAYQLQIGCDTSSLPRYLGALEALARAPMPGKEGLHVKVATERSLDRYTSGK